MIIEVLQYNTVVRIEPQGNGVVNVVPNNVPEIINIEVVNGGGGSGGGNTGYISAGTTIAPLGTVIFSNSNSISFGLSSNIITASFDAGTMSQSSIVFSNSNNVSFTLNGSTLNASASFPSQTGYVFSNSNNVSFGTNGSTVTATATFAGQTQFVLSNSNGLAWGTNGSTVTGSYSSYIFSNSNNISFGSNGSTVTATVTFPAQTNYMFSNSNGVSFGTNGSTITATVKTDYLTTAMASDAGSLFVNTSAGLNLTNVSATFNSNSISISVNTGLTSQSNQAISAANGSFTFQTATFANSNGVSFSTGTQGVFATVKTDYLTTARASNDGVGLNTALTGNGVAWTVNSSGISLNVPAFLTTARGSTDGIGLNTAQTNVTWTVNSSGVSINAAGYAGTNTAMTGGSVTLNSSGISINLPAYLTTAMASNASTQFVQANAVFNGTNASGTIASNAISVSVAKEVTLSYFQHQENIFTSVQTVVNQTMTVKPFIAPFYITGTMMKIAGSLSASTNTSATTASANITLWMGIYSLNGSTLSLASSGSANNGFQWSQSASSTANTSINGMREMTVPMNINMTPGMYWLGAVISSATTYTGASYSLYGNNLVAGGAGNAQFSPIGGGSTYTAFPLMGLYTSAVSAGPATIIAGGINFTGASMVQRANIYFEILNNTL